MPDRAGRPWGCAGRDQLHVCLSHPDSHRRSRNSTGSTVLLVPGERVADCHRRFGLSPTPKHVVCMCSNGITVSQSSSAGKVPEGGPRAETTRRPRARHGRHVRGHFRRPPSCSRPRKAPPGRFSASNHAAVSEEHHEPCSGIRTTPQTTTRCPRNVASHDAVPVEHHEPRRAIRTTSRATSRCPVERHRVGRCARGGPASRHLHPALPFFTDKVRNIPVPALPSHRPDL